MKKIHNTQYIHKIFSIPMCLGGDDKPHSLTWARIVKPFNLKMAENFFAAKYKQ